MGKKPRHLPRTAFAALREMPGTRVLFWVVQDCPYCGAEHLHVAGNQRSADPGETLGEYPAPCKPERTYELTLAPRQRKKTGKHKRQRGWDDEDY